MNNKAVPDRNAIESAYSSVIGDLETKPFHETILKMEKAIRKEEPYRGVLSSSSPFIFYKIAVSEHLVERALTVANLFLNVIEKLGCKIIKGQFAFKINGVSVNIRLKEFFKQTPYIPSSEEKRKAKADRYYIIPSYNLIPSGELAFIISAHFIQDKVIRDKPNKKIEDQIVDMITWIFSLPQKVEYALEQKRLAEEEQRENGIRRRERENLEYEDKRKLEQLKNEADDFHQAIKIYEYIQAVESIVLTMRISPNRKNEIREKLKWAKAKADWLDPIIAKEDPVLGRKHYKRFFYDKE